MISKVIWDLMQVGSGFNGLLGSVSSSGEMNKIIPISYKNLATTFLLHHIPDTGTGTVIVFHNPGGTKIFLQK
jgi:hypothetical protein